MGGAKNCPETPRQKMIGMMYLVLTAMLALNVSTDILNGFTMVDNSLHSSIEASETRNARLYQDFEGALMKNPAKTQAHYDEAQKVRRKADSLYNYLQNFKYDIARLADGGRVDAMIAQGEDPTLHIQNNSDLDVAGEYAIVGGHGQELKNNVSQYCAFITSLINHKDSVLSSAIKATLATEKAYNAHDRAWVDWEIAVFDGMPIGASMAVLSKMQNDVRTTEGQIIQYLMDQTDAGDVRVNKLNAYVIPNSNYVIRGGKYQAQIIVAAVDTTQRPDYYVDGAKLSEHGIYEVTASGVGKKNYNGKIVIKNDEEIVELPFTGEYTVGEPAVTISNNDLNIMYRGYENKFSVSVPGVSDDRVRVTVTGAKAVQKGKEWIINPGDGVKTVTINVQAELDGKMQPMGSREYRVKQLPPPTAFFLAKEKEYPTGNIAASVLSNSSGTIVASYGPDGLLDIPFTVTSFRAIINNQTTPATGNKFTKQQLDQIAKLKKNQMVILQDIRAKGPGDQELRLSPLVLTVN